MTYQVGALLFLVGLWWELKPLPEPDDNPGAYRKAQRRQIGLGALRMMCLAVGAALLVGHWLGGPGTPQDLGALGLLWGMYSLLVLMVQRSERNRRLASLFILTLVALLLNNYALYRDWGTENAWAIYGALLANYLFWLGIGRRYPPGSSDEIQVFGME